MSFKEMIWFCFLVLFDLLMAFYTWKLSSEEYLYNLRLVRNECVYSLAYLLTSHDFNDYVFDLNF